MMKGECIENTDRVLLANGSYCVYGAQTGTRNGEYVAAGNRADGVSRNGAGISALPVLHPDEKKNGNRLV